MPDAIRVKKYKEEKKKRIDRIYEKYGNALNNLKKRQSEIISRFINRKDEKAVNEIRKKLINM